MTLAQNLRAGHLSEVWVPDEAHEAMRDLVRVRESAAQDRRRSARGDRPRRPLIRGGIGPFRATTFG